MMEPKVGVFGRRRGKKGSLGEDLRSPNLAMGPICVEKGGGCVRWVSRY